MEYAKKQFLKIILIFITYVASLVVSGVLFFTLRIDENIKLSLLLIILIIALIGLLWIKPRITYHSESYSFYKLKSFQSPPMKLSSDFEFSSLPLRLKNNDFLVFYKDENFTILNRYTYDKTLLATKRPMLELFVLISNPDLNYNSLLIDKQINLLEEKYYKNKTKITNYSVILIKKGYNLTESVIKECDEVTFSKVRYRSIVTINAYIDEVKNTIYFLHSDLYHPNLYYKYAVDLIQSIIT